jgi:hypothetical protein
MIPGLGGGLSASVGGGGPSSVDAQSAFDSSGWNVNFGAGTIESTRSQAEGGAGAVQGYMPYILVAAGLLVVWRMTRKG